MKYAGKKKYLYVENHSLFYQEDVGYFFPIPSMFSVNIMLFTLILLGIDFLRSYRNYYTLGRTFENSFCSDAVFRLSFPLLVLGCSVYIKWKGTEHLKLLLAPRRSAGASCPQVLLCLLAMFSCFSTHLPCKLAPFLLHLCYLSTIILLLSMLLCAQCYICLWEI